MKTIMTWILSLCMIVYVVILCVPQYVIPTAFSTIHQIKEVSRPYQLIVYGMTSIFIVGYCIWVIKKVNERKQVEVVNTTSYIDQVHVSEYHMQVEEDCILIKGKIRNAKKVSVAYVVVYIQFFDRKGVMINADEYYVVGRDELSSGSVCDFSYRYYKKLKIVSCKVSVIRYKEVTHKRKKKVEVKG